MYFVSVDCGGTKTAFVLTNEKGQKLSEYFAGPGNHLVTGADKVTSMVKDGVHKLCKDVNITVKDLAMVYIASAGYNPLQGCFDYDDLAREKYDFKYYVTSDVPNGLRGSLLNEPGIHLLAGTGTNGLATDGNVIYENVGGWGYYCGSDEGSAYWIASKLINHFERQVDGREERTLLYDYLMKKYNLKHGRGMITVIIKTLNNERDKIATLAIDVANLCEQGDPVCRQIMFEAGQELGNVAKALFKNNNLQEPVTISYSGSVFKSIEYLKPGIEEELKDIKHNLRAPILSPLAGGILEAFNKSGHKYNDEVIDNLRNI